MPVYEYIEVESGRHVEFNVPITHRDTLPGFARVPVPRRLNIVLGAPDPTNADQAVPRALKQLEAREPHDRIARQTGFSTTQMKRIWDIK